MIKHYFNTHVGEELEEINGQMVKKKPNYIPLPKEDAQNVFPGLNRRQMTLLDVGKVKEALIDEDKANSPKMLCYDPKTSSFF